MRAACVIILASLTVSMSPVIRCQTLPGDGDPSLDELFQRAESLLVRSILTTQMEDDNNANGEQAQWLEKRQHPGKRLSLEQAVLEEPTAQSELAKRQHPGKRYLMLLHKRQHPGKRLCEDCDRASILLELLDNINKSRAEEKRQHPGKRSELEDGLTEQE